MDLEVKTSSMIMFYFRQRSLKEPVIQCNIKILNCFRMKKFQILHRSEYGEVQTTTVLASYFPIDSPETMNKIEEKLKDPSTLKQVVTLIGNNKGKDFNQTVNFVMRKMLNKDMSLNYSACGRKGKLNFSSLRLYKVALEAIKLYYKDIQDQAIRSKTSSVLATSGDIEGWRKSRSKAGTYSGKV
ncbi:hypothetical protein FQR65_LT13423 [Abscondita terminalis]|nr:hypothetical protein FQR65_LT13423 [Abscondita terminalis]